MNSSIKSSTPAQQLVTAFLINRMGTTLLFAGLTIVLVLIALFLLVRGEARGIPVVWAGDVA
jgi:hypothetical protein